MSPEINITGPVQIPQDKLELRRKAKELEAAFLSEMLSHSGLGQTSSDFSGGTGEEQFASFLRNEQARKIVDKGGLGLAEAIFNSLVKLESARP